MQTGKKPTCFVYPFGAKNDLTEKLIKEMGFSCTLTCTEKPNIITKNPDSLYELGRYRRDRNESMQIFLSELKCSHNIYTADTADFSALAFLTKASHKAMKMKNSGVVIG